MEGISSMSDDRAENNRVRHQYRALTDEEKSRVVSVKDAGEEFLQIVRNLPDTEERTFAIIKVKEAVMWAVRGITA